MHDETAIPVGSNHPSPKNDTSLRSYQGANGARTANQITSTLDIAPNLIPADCHAIRPEMLTLIELNQRQIDSIVREVPGGAVNVQDIYPLTPLQEGILFHRLLNERSDSYVLSTLFELPCKAQIDLFVHAIQAVIDRHDILRSAVLSENLPRPVQVVYRHAVIPTQELQLDPDRDSIEQLRERMRPGSIALDIGHAPMGRLIVASKAGNPARYALLQIHHLVCDDRSLKTIVSEALMCLQGRREQLPTPIAYRDYVADTLKHANIAESEIFFRHKLAEIDESTAPFGITDVYGDGTQIEEAQHTVSAAHTRRLRTQTQCAGVSAARLFHAAWALVVAHTADKDEVVFGTVVLARQQRNTQSQRMLGMSVNTLPLRLRLKELSAKQLVEHTHRELVELLNHEHAPLTLAQRCSGVSDKAPLFTTLLNYRRSASDLQTEPSGEVAVRILARGEAWSNYPISLTVDDTGEEFVLTAQTDRRIDPRRLIGYLETAVIGLAEALEQAPQTSALALSILPPMERGQIVERFNATYAGYPQNVRIPELFERQVECAPHAVALVCGDQQLTYAQLNRRANQLAHRLVARGIRPNDRVAVYVERSLELVVGLLGILKAGGAYVPLDVSYPTDRVAYMLQDSSPVAVLTQARLKDTLPASAAYVVTLDADEDGLDRESAHNPDATALGLTSRNLAYVIYTSGSTGTPKGVMVEHRSLVNLVHWHCEAFEVRAVSRCSCAASVGFDAAAWEIWPPLSVGATLVLSSSGISTDTDALLDWWSHEALDVSFLPTPLAELAFSRNAPNPRLRSLLVGGDRLRHRPVDRPFALVNNYGPTETTVVATSGRIHDADPVLHIGRPIANTQIYILDRRGQLVPLGVAGEIYIGGVGVARGYLNRPELTADRFLSDPFKTDSQARIYKTGDLGRWRADGTIEYLGRNDHQIKIRGFRIELAEIEARLAGHEHVKEAVVVALEDAAGEKRLVAYIVQRAQTRLSVEDLRAHVKLALPEYMVPSAFVIIERLPLTRNGKLDRHSLPAPELNAYSTRQFEPPQGEVEQSLAAIWADLLGFARIGRNDNFFELGGHSLLIVQMMERLRGVGLSADARRVFESSSLADLATALTKTEADHFQIPPNLIPHQCSTITPQMLPLIELEAVHIERILRTVPGGVANIQDIYPLLQVQEGILFHYLLNENAGDPYILSMLLSVSSQPRLTELIAALQYVVDRNEVLRTAIRWEQLPQPVRVIYRSAALPVETLLLDEDRDVLQQLKEQMKPGHIRLDLRNAPLMRVQVAANPDGIQFYVLLQVHHLVCDHETLNILLPELVAYIEGRAHQLPDPVSYRNHVARVLAHGKMDDTEEFFRQKLGDVDEPTAPFGLLDVKGNGERLDRAIRSIEPDLAMQIRTQARRLGVSAATLFHAAWALVVSHTSGRDDVVYGTVLLGRMQGTSESRRALGMFINTLPLRLRLRHITAQQLVEQTHKELGDLLTHEQASLAVAQRCSGIERSEVLFTPLLNYRHSTSKATSEFTSAAGMTLLGVRSGTSYPIVLSVEDHGDSFDLDLEADERASPQRLIGYVHLAMQSLVQALQSAPQTNALSLSTVPGGELTEVIGSFNATQVAFPQTKLIHELFEEQAERTPEAIAVMYLGQSLTYGELNVRSNQLARYLKNRGIAPDQLVAICVERSLEMLIGLLGILKAGGAYVPLDPSSPAQRLEHVLLDANPRMVLTQKQLKRALPPTDAQTLSLDTDWSEIAREDERNLNARELGLGPQHLAYVIYTSGSTGTPKGVMVEHRNIVNYAVYAARQFDVASGSGSLIGTSVSFDLMLTGLYPTLLCGRTVRLCPHEQGLPLLSSEILRSSNLAPLKLTPSHLSLLEKALLDGQLAGRVRVLVLGGEPLQASAVQLWRKHAPGTRIFNHYGPTETTVGCIVHELGQQTSGAVPIGKPIANTRVYILDRHMRPVPIGVAGEIYIGGRGVTRGYLNRAELTAQRFLADPFSADLQARMYKTGDLGQWRSDGTIEYHGRNDFQVKIRGYRIELGEIEAQLARHARVKEVAVLVREDMPGEKRLVAYCVCRDSGGAEHAAVADSLRTHLRSSLPEYMVPNAFVVMECMPLTSNGKLDRRALPIPGLENYRSAQYEPPQGNTEAVLRDIWQELLRVERIGRDDDFFELGGHSLLATRLISRIGDRLQVDLSVRAIFEAPTVRQLSALIADEESAQVAQEALWLRGLSRDLRRDINEMRDVDVLAEIAKLQDELNHSKKGDSASN